MCYVLCVCTDGGEAGGQQLQGEVEPSPAHPGNEQLHEAAAVWDCLLLMHVDGSKKIPAVLRILSAAAARSLLLLPAPETPARRNTRSAWFARDTTYKLCRT